MYTEATCSAASSMSTDKLHERVCAPFRRGLAMLLPFSLGFNAFLFVFALTTQDGLHDNALRGGPAILPMATLFVTGPLAPFAAAIGVQLAIVVLLVLAIRALPSFSTPPPTRSSPMPDRPHPRIHQGATVTITPTFQAGLDTVAELARRVRKRVHAARRYSWSRPPSRSRRYRLLT